MRGGCESRSLPPHRVHCCLPSTSGVIVIGTNALHGFHDDTLYVCRALTLFKAFSYPLCHLIQLIELELEQRKTTDKLIKSTPLTGGRGTGDTAVRQSVRDAGGTHEPALLPAAEYLNGGTERKWDLYVHGTFLR